MSIGVLILHGFSGGPYEVQPLTDYLKKKIDWIYELPTFSGHGDTDELAMKGFKAEHWLMDAEIAFRNLAKRVDDVVVIGFSMGGVIAMYLAKRYPVKKLVLLSAAAKYVSPTQLLQDLRFMAEDAVHGTIQDNELFSRYKHKLKNVPLSSTMEFMKIVEKVEPYISHIQCPVFVVQGALDGIVPSTTARLIYDKVQSKRKMIYISKEGKHHICYSDDCDEWFAQVSDFLMEP
ncbi:alpha/beta hydrolase [Lysinibacillus sp. 54212]|uniref:alpha/beta hydrolase n=1 Tax=Lysinibacillus sp. 54212 TaxID=3119829 RepID=UPI002FC91FD7